VSFANSLPLGGGGFSLGALSIPGADSAANADVDADWNIITPAYFDTMRIPIVQGRAFDGRDRRGAGAVAIVNESMAHRFWPAGAVGRRIVLRDPDGPQTLEIVGVARDSKYRSLADRARFFLYVPLEQQYISGITLLVKTDGTRSVVPLVRDAVRSIDRTLPIVSAQTLTEFIGIGLLPQRMLVAVAGSLGVVGLLLAALGVYGITAYAVSSRTREIGLRMALGAEPSGVLRLMLRQGMTLVIIGLAIGALAALGVTRVVAGLLYGITPGDPVSYLVAVTLFVAVTLVASYLPARRAARVDPTVALRAE
jgi:predicted permease